MSAAFKPGATFSAIATLPIVYQGETLPTIAGWTFRSQLRDREGGLVAELTCTVADATAFKVLLAATAAETADWPAGQTLVGDIWGTDPTGTIRVPSGTFTLVLGEPVTHD